jgi:hypothetical protein
VFEAVPVEAAALAKLLEMVLSRLETAFRDVTDSVWLVVVLGLQGYIGTLSSSQVVACSCGACAWLCPAWWQVVAARHRLSNLQAGQGGPQGSANVR